MMLEHPQIVPRSRKTLDFSRVGVAWGGRAFHHVVALVQVVVLVVVAFWMLFASFLIVQGFLHCAGLIAAAAP